MPDVKPTRINLINIKNYIKIVKNGYSILKRKRESLVIEFMKILKEESYSRADLYNILQSAYRTAAFSISYYGEQNVLRVASYISNKYTLSIDSKNIMGVKIPLLQGEIELSSSLLTSRLFFDDIFNNFSKSLDMLIKIAKKEESLVRLVNEIDKTKRRVNALEYIHIPKLQQQANYIKTVLAEQERDMFSSLKHVKKKIASSSRY
ncbi:MAG: V-type ATP synthase subunit D [Candidatus Micrarchaeota archaeon]|nr:MAG: V-type ATP synthase subunit D [Candidatus Micrarchaeota archaeon]